MLELYCIEEYDWSNILSYVRQENRDDISVRDSNIYCNVIHQCNITYVLDIIAYYCSIRKDLSNIKSNSIFPSRINKLLYNWIGRKKYDISNMRLYYYTIMSCFLFMMIVSCFFLLFVLVLT